jgi:hypothetical protein
MYIKEVALVGESKQKTYNLTLKRNRPAKSGPRHEGSSNVKGSIGACIMTNSRLSWEADLPSTAYVLRRREKSSATLSIWYHWNVHVSYG